MIEVPLENPIEKVNNKVGKMPGDAGIQILGQDRWPPGIGWYRGGGA
jgi:hypothetical protein